MTYNMTDKYQEQWEIDPDGMNEPHWIDFIYKVPEENYYWDKAKVTWDGTVHFYSTGNEPFRIGERYPKEYAENIKYMYLEIDEMIEKLQKLKEAAIKHFKLHGEDWPR